MKLFLLTLLISLSAALVQAQELHFKYGRNKEVTVKDLDINLEVTHNIVRATITANFYNPKGWQQEGEIIVPLPPGATISDYELEINGGMRKASIVENELALRAYEEIKARNVDPGLVEKKANNNFKIRVFPIVGKQTKRTTLSFVYRLPKVGDVYFYELPLKFTRAIENFNVTVTGDCNITTKHLVFNQNKNDQTHRDSVSTLKDTIRISVPYIKGPTLTLEPAGDGENVHALYSLPIPENLPLTKPFFPKKINLLWDTSDSALDRKLPLEIKLLENYFQHNRNTEVTLHTLGYDPQLIGTFKVIDADWKMLQSAIISLNYDGAANLHAGLAERIDSNQFTLIFSSNISQTDHLLSLIPSPHIINSAHQFHSEEIFSQITQQQLTVISKQPGKQLRSNNPRQIDFFITSPQESLSINIGFGNEIIHTFNIKDKHIYKTIRSPLQTIIAQENLLSLQQTHAPKQTIIDFCKRYRLTSDHTSMIVLETMHDYVKYKIEPQDPTLLAEYKQKINQVTSRNSILRIAAQAPKIPYPWHISTQKQALKNIESFQQAREQFFIKDQYDSSPMIAVESWKSELNKLHVSKEKIQTQKDYLLWLEQVSKLHTKRKSFFTLKDNWPNDKDIFVSLRGRVPVKIVHQLKPNTDLRAFLINYEIESAALYRNSHRVIYNLASESSQATPLKSGDMIVALKTKNYYVEEENNPKNQPFIKDDGNDISQFISYDDFRERYGTIAMGDDPFGDSDPTLIYTPNSEATTTGSYTNLSPIDLQKTKTTAEDWKKFEKNISQDAQKAYLQLKSNNRQNLHFYTTAARILYATKNPELARKVLSNIMAGEEHQFTAMNRYLLWLIEFQDYQEVINLTKLYDPDFTNYTIRFLLTKAHLLNKSLTKELKETLTQEYDHLGLSYLIKSYSPSEKISEHDFYITATAETNGISDILKIDFNDNYANEFPIRNISDQGLIISNAPGTSVYKMRQAIPGEYKVSIPNKIIATFQVDIIQFLGTPREIKKRITIHTDGTSDWKEIYSFHHQFPEN